MGAEVRSAERAVSTDTAGRMRRRQPTQDPAREVVIRSHEDTAMDTKRIRTRLMELRERIAARHSRIDKHINRRDEPLPPDSAERASELANRETLEQLGEGTEVELRQIDRALSRLDAGSYGACEQCGNPIAKARLEMLPFATHCITCAAKAG